MQIGVGTGLGTFRAALDPYGPEIVSNGSMEAGSPPTGWSVVGSGAISSAADERAGGSGTKSLDAIIAVGQTAVTIHQDIVLEIGKTYHFSVWTKNVDSDHLAISVYTNDYGSQPVLSPDIAGGAWLEYSVDFLCSAAAGHLILVAIGAAGQSARFDDISIKEVL